MDESGQPVRLTQWLAMVCGFAVTGASFGWGIGMLSAVISGDYVAVPADYASLGLRAGLFAGTVLAAWRATGPAPPWGISAVLRASGAMVFVAGGAVCLVAALALLLSYLPGVVPEYANLAHPRRYVMFAALHHFWPYALIFGIIAGGVRQPRSRPA